MQEHYYFVSIHVFFQEWTEKQRLHPHVEEFIMFSISISQQAWSVNLLHLGKKKHEKYKEPIWSGEKVVNENAARWVLDCSQNRILRVALDEKLVTAFCSAHFLIDCAQRGKYWAKILFANPFGAIHFSRVIAAADKRERECYRLTDDDWERGKKTLARFDFCVRRRDGLWRREIHSFAQQTSKSFPPPNATLLFSSFIRNVKWCMSTNSLSFAPATEILFSYYFWRHPC